MITGGLPEIERRNARKAAFAYAKVIDENPEFYRPVERRSALTMETPSSAPPEDSEKRFHVERPRSRRYRLAGHRFHRASEPLYNAVGVVRESVAHPVLHS
jgi:phosphoserine aminotransferase